MQVDVHRTRRRNEKEGQKKASPHWGSLHPVPRCRHPARWQWESEAQAALSRGSPLRRVIGRGGAQEGDGVAFE